MLLLLELALSLRQAIVGVSLAGNFCAAAVGLDLGCTMHQIFGLRRCIMSLQLAVGCAFILRCLRRCCCIALLFRLWLLLWLLLWLMRLLRLLLLSLPLSLLLLRAGVLALPLLLLLLPLLP